VLSRPRATPRKGPSDLSQIQSEDPDIMHPTYFQVGLAHLAPSDASSTNGHSGLTHERSAEGIVTRGGVGSSNGNGNVGRMPFIPHHSQIPSIPSIHSNRSDSPADGHRVNTPPISKPPSLNDRSRTRDVEIESSAGVGTSVRGSYSFYTPSMVDMPLPGGRPIEIQDEGQRGSGRSYGQSSGNVNGSGRWSWGQRAGGGRGDPAQYLTQVPGKSPTESQSQGETEFEYLGSRRARRGGAGRGGN